MYRFIWKIKLNDDVSDDAFIRHWHDSSAILQEYPGARGTLIHRARDEDRTFFLVAQWESQALRDAMQSEIDANQTERAQRYRRFAASDTYGEIQTMFAGEQIGEVIPESA